MAQVNAQMSMMPQQLDLQRREMGVKEKQLGFQEKLYNQIGQGQNLPPGFVLDANGHPIQDWNKYNAMIKAKQLQDEAGNANVIGQKANAFRQQVGHQPTNLEDHDDDPALVDWYKAVAKGKKPDEIRYDDNGNIIDDQDDE